MLPWLDAVLVLLMLTSFWLLGSSRLQACIRAVAFQGVLLGLIPLCSKWPDITLRLAVVAILSTIIKAIRVAPHVAARGARGERAQRGSAVGRIHHVAAAGHRAVGRRHAHRRTSAVQSLHVSTLLVPVAIFTVLCGLLLIVSRNTAVMQVIGYLGLENGIYVFGWAFAIEEPFLVEMGVLLDVFVAVFVMGITMHQLSREFDTIETDELASLKD